VVSGQLPARQSPAEVNSAGGENSASRFICNWQFEELDSRVSKLQITNHQLQILQTGVETHADPLG
jgi:hypothetical protein